MPHLKALLPVFFILIGLVTKPGRKYLYQSLVLDQFIEKNKSNFGRCSIATLHCANVQNMNRAKYVSNFLTCVTGCPLKTICFVNSVYTIFSLWKKDPPHQTFPSQPEQNFKVISKSCTSGISRIHTSENWLCNPN